VKRLHSRYPNLDIHLHADTSEVLVQADPKRIGQVIENLVSNAVKYAPTSPLEITLKKSGDQLIISVRDCGPGIPAEFARQIFKRFYRAPGAKDQVRGSGLGLYICEQIVHAHGGEIRVESSVGKGAEFIVALPYQAVSTPVTT
ncbi:MAG TPA: ATP-binding protein, partial [Terriglobales bacterium]|nr:ATP-binding protein [Terriglobales bacterium]